MLIIISGVFTDKIMYEQYFLIIGLAVKIKAL